MDFENLKTVKLNTRWTQLWLDLVHTNIALDRLPHPHSAYFEWVRGWIRSRIVLSLDRFGVVLSRCLLNCVLFDCSRIVMEMKPLVSFAKF